MPRPQPCAARTSQIPFVQMQPNCKDLGWSGNLVLALGLAMVLPFAASDEGLKFAPGTYTGTGPGKSGPHAVEVEVTVSDSAITDIKVTQNRDSPWVREAAGAAIPERILKYQSVAVDAVTGATMTSVGIISAVIDSLRQAGADMTLLVAPISKSPAEDIEMTADVVIVGGGGAGMSAAVAAVQAGASVVVVEKAGYTGGHTVVSGGALNSYTPEPRTYAHFDERRTGVESLITDALDETAVSDEHKALQDEVRAEYEAYLETDHTLFDSPSWHALQTFNGGDKLGSIPHIKQMTEFSYDTTNWLEELGVEWRDGVMQGPGSMYPRALRTVLPRGSAYLVAFSNFLEDKDATILLETTAKGLIMDGDKVVGVDAEGRDGNKVTLYAGKNVILATGGFAGNVELRQQYGEGEKWPDLGPSLRTTNISTITGDGLFMARDAGAELVNMEQIQLAHIVDPISAYTGGTLPNTTYSIFVNREGERFTREDGRRDHMAAAILEQTGGSIFIVSSYDVTGALDEDELSEFKPVPYVADTLGELAEKIGVPADTLIETVGKYNAHALAQTEDEFGRVVYTAPIKKPPFYAQERAPAAHHTMGGLNVNLEGQVLKADGTPLEGLYSAGEITGVIHGTNRLGGNAILDVIVNGRIYGTNAAK